MPVLKCKMCGGDLHVVEGQTVCECEYCGTKQTLPKVDNERKLNLYDRANHFRRANDFDKAMNVYEQILNEDRTDAEAYWSLVLCRYGIEYVEDPATHKRIPTVNRAQYTSIFADEDYKQALEYATPEQKVVYQEEARTIDTIQKGILEISQKEEPFDVFICYKETDNNGRRTPDSVLANDLYHQLTNEGFKVFFSRITLEDKLGTAYEPYIFAALNSAKVMVVLGTRPEYFNAVWVKNEWSRYLSLIRKGEKKVLIPAYRDMDPYDLPEEFSHLQAQDMSKLGFMQDLIRGIKKLTETDKKAKETVVINQSNQNIGPLLKRIFIFLEDGDYDSANEYCDRVLDMDPENEKAYLGKLMAEEKVGSVDELFTYYKKLFNETHTVKLQACEPDSNHINSMISSHIVEGGYLDEKKLQLLYEFDSSYFSQLPTRKKQLQQIKDKLKNDRLFTRVKQYASNEIKNRIDDVINTYQDRILQAEQDDQISIEKVKESYRKYLIETDEDVQRLYKEACEQRERDYQKFIEQYNKCDDVNELEQIALSFKNLKDYQEADEYINKCHSKISGIKEAIRIQAEKEAEEKRKAEEAARKKRNKTIMIVVPILVALAIFAYIFTTVFVPKINYSKALASYDSGNYAEAYGLFQKLGDYEDSKSYLEKCYPYWLKDSLKTASVGSYVTLGTYEQDNNTSNGSEPIEWLVLEKENDKLLIISRYGLDCQQYNPTAKNVTWGNSFIRKWLNNTFYNAVFSDIEKQLIAITYLKADNNSNSNTAHGNGTNDRAFLLSTTEAYRYFSTTDTRAIQGTEYAYAQGTLKGSNGNCWWWLRTSGSDSSLAARVDNVGQVSTTGNYVTDDSSAVRPALWLNLEP